MIEKHFEIYKAFNDPPGTPTDLRCIGCKVFSGLGLLGLSSIGFIQFLRLSKKKTGNPTLWATLAASGAGAAMLLFVRANEDLTYNELKKRENLAKLRDERRSRAQSQKN